MSGAEARRDAILVELRQSGGRLTSARRAIVDALVGASDHVTAEQLAAAVQQHRPDVHLTTVYRFLDALETLGLVDHVHLGHGRAVYHLADEAHHHLVCEECGVVVEVPDEVFTALGHELMARYGFEARPHHFAVVGRCESCRGTPR